MVLNWNELVAESILAGITLIAILEYRKWREPKHAFGIIEQVFMVILFTFIGQFLVYTLLHQRLNLSMGLTYQSPIHTQRPPTVTKVPTK